MPIDDLYPPVIARYTRRSSPIHSIGEERVKLMFVIGGWATLQAEGYERTLVPGSIVIVPARTASAVFHSPFAETVTLCLPDEFFRSQLSWLPVAHPLVHHIIAALHRDSPLGLIDLGESGNRAMLPLLRMITEISHAQGTVFALLARFADLLDAIATISGRSNPLDLAGEINIPRPSVSAAIHAMITNLDRTWAVPDLARAVALSPSQLTRQFREDLGPHLLRFFGMLVPTGWQNCS